MRCDSVRCTYQKARREQGAKDLCLTASDDVREQVKVNEGRVGARHDASTEWGKRKTCTGVHTKASTLSDTFEIIHASPISMPICLLYGDAQWPGLHTPAQASQRRRRSRTTRGRTAVAEIVRAASAGDRARGAVLATALLKGIGHDGGGEEREREENELGAVHDNGGAGGSSPGLRRAFL
jgi:hypothetical protein